MKFSSQEEYGLRCLLQFVRSGGTAASLTINDISRAEGLSTAYVAKLLRMLRLSGWVESTRGQVGGYALARPPEQILVREVLDTLGGRFYADDFCGRYPGNEEECTHSVDCIIKPLWNRVQDAIDRELAGLTLSDLASGMRLSADNNRLIMPEGLRILGQT